MSSMVSSSVRAKLIFLLNMVGIHMHWNDEINEMENRNYCH